MRWAHEAGDFVRLQEHQNKPHVLVSLLFASFSGLSNKGQRSRSQEGVWWGCELSFSNIPALSIIYACNDGGRPDLCKPGATYITSCDQH